MCWREFASIRHAHTRHYIMHTLTMLISPQVCACVSQASCHRRLLYDCSATLTDTRTHTNIHTFTHTHTHTFQHRACLCVPNKFPTLNLVVHLLSDAAPHKRSCGGVSQACAKCNNYLMHPQTHLTHTTPRKTSPAG